MRKTLLLTAVVAGAAAATTAELALPLAIDDAVVDAPRMRRPPGARAIHTVAPDDAALFYSPYNWAVSHASAGTINAGAYIKTFVQSTFVNLTFDTAAMVSPQSQLYWQVDNGPLTPALVAPVVTVAIPPNNTHGDVPWHTLTVIVKSTTETANRGAAPGPSTRVIFPGLVVDGAAAPWLPSGVNVLIYGDSITEGVLTLGGSQRSDTDHNDATVCYSYRLGALLGAEIGAVGAWAG